MVFSSLFFLYTFLPLSLALYFLLPSREGKNGVLILSSLVFYAWGEPFFVLFLLGSSVVDYFVGRIIEKNKGTWKAKGALLFSLIYNLGILLVYKYSGFLVETLNGVTGLGLPVPDLPLPLGISFYTFQTLSYVIDVYRGEVESQKSYPRYLLYLSLFHQLVAGPIVRYKDVARDINHRHFSWDDAAYGVRRFSYGLAKKVILANNLGALVTSGMASQGPEASVLGAWWAILLFALQIFFDFSAYSDMAIGLGRIYGFHYKENFDYPYAAKSATEFWRRWHMSLGSFFRDYLYIPLGGNRKRATLNLFIVWFLTGLWHGAHGNFILWGLYYGVLIFLERWVENHLKWKSPRVVSHLYLVILTLVGWNLFYLEGSVSGLENLARMFSFGTLPWVSPLPVLQFQQNFVLVVLALLACVPWARAVRSQFENRRPRFLTVWDKGLGIGWSVILLLLSTAFLVGSSYNPFLYFRF